jgi:hypothetical protein
MSTPRVSGEFEPGREYFDATAEVQEAMDRPELSTQAPLSEIQVLSEKQYKVGRRVLKIIEDPTKMNTTGVFFPQEQRATMSQKEKNDLFTNAIKPISTKYDFMTVDLSNEKRMEDLCNLLGLVAKTKAAHVMYDMDDVFQIVFPETQGSSHLRHTKIVDLYTSYEKVTIEEVAQSNEWYRLWVETDHQRENLLLTYKQLENSMSAKLFDKCFEKYEAFPDNQKGGPLLFVIMMKELVTNSEQATTYLKKMLSTMKIRDLQGENVSRATSLIRGVYKHLYFVNQVPEDFLTTLIRIFQTSSVPAFNRTFEMYEELIRYNKNEARKDGYPEIESVLRAAELRYRELLQTDEWTGSNAKGRASVFRGEASKASNVTCWNCGKTGHVTHQCPDPRNNERINANRTKMRNKKGKTRNNGETAANTATSSNNPTFKFRPPEPHENNKREIDGKHMYFNPRTKRWVLDRVHPSNKGKTFSAANTAATTENANNNAKTTPDDAMVKAWMANTAKDFEQSLREFASRYSA